MGYIYTLLEMDHIHSKDVFFTSVIVLKVTVVIKRKFYLSATLLKHISPKHAIIYVTLKSFNLLLEAHFNLSYNYANSVMENDPF